MKAFRSTTTHLVVALAVSTQLAAQTTRAQEDTASPTTAEAEPSATADSAPATDAATGETSEPAGEGAPDAEAATADSAPTTTSSEPAVEANAAAAETVNEPPATARKVAVLDLRAADDDAPLANALAAVLTSELGRRDGHRAISRNEVRALVEQQSASALLGCESEKCAADLGSVLEADGIVTGSVDFVDEAYLVSLALIDPTGKATTQRLEWAWHGPTAELVTIAGPAVDTLVLGDGASALRGALRVDAPDGAEIQLNGETLGTAPLDTPTTGLPIGVHDLVVRLDGYSETRSSAVVTANETSVTSVTLDALPFYSQGWFWGTVAATAGGVVVTAASITAFVLASTLPLPPKVIEVDAGLPAAAQGLSDSEGGAR
jgi:hypothetical protein